MSWTPNRVRSCEFQKTSWSSRRRCHRHACSVSYTSMISRCQSYSRLEITANGRCERTSQCHRRRVPTQGTTAPAHNLPGTQMDSKNCPCRTPTRRPTQSGNRTSIPFEREAPIRIVVPPASSAPLSRIRFYRVNY